MYKVYQSTLSRLINQFNQKWKKVVKIDLLLQLK